MSTGKRLAKRSILGTRVAAPQSNGLFYTGLIQAVKTCEDPSQANRYGVRFDDDQSVSEFLETDLVGPGFKSIACIRIMPGQLVYVTHCQREMPGRVVRHDFDTQDVIITVGDGEETLLKKIDEVRLLESRKSARLVNSDTDFSKLADVNITSSGDGGAGGKKTKAIEVPKSDYVQIAGSRKRRTSENVMDEEEVMTECSAAMLLMKLSCSPLQQNMPIHSQTMQYGSSVPEKQLPSPVDSSGASSFRSATPSPPLSSSTGTSTADEGIVKDFVDSVHHHRQPRVVYQCTYPGCRIAAMKTVRAIESHVRKEHLLRTDDHLDDGEEEFYYTEVDLPSVAPRSRAYTEPTSHMANLSLADHLDMARPAHEDPMTGFSGFRNGSKVRSFSGSNNGHNKSSLLISQAASVTTPITIAPSVGSPGKYILISPPGSDSVSSSAPSSTGSGGGLMMKSPGHRRVREGKKCRKVYGLEQRDLWCTQCKWKKACARFGKPSSSINNNNNASSTVAEGMEHQQTSLLMPAVPSLPPVRAIKF